MNLQYCEPPSNRLDWATPDFIFDPLNREFSFDLDVCAVAENAKCKRFFAPHENSLAQEWVGNCWMNPPYGKTIGHWIYKAMESARSGQATVVSLLPVRSNNEWWKSVILGEVRFIRKKLKFVGAESDAMFPSAIVIWHRNLQPSGVMKVWEPKP